MSSPGEYILDSLKTNVLQEKRPLLCENLRPKDHYPFLRSRYILSEDDEEEIELQQLRKQKVHKFLDILVKRGGQGFNELVQSIIHERTQLFLAKELNKAFEEKQKRLHALMNANEASSRMVNDREQKTYPAQNGREISNNKSTKNSSSSMGADTDSLPKPVMGKKLEIKKNEKDNKDSLKVNGYEMSSADVDDESLTLDSKQSVKASKT